MTKRIVSRPAAVLGLPTVCLLATLCFNAMNMASPAHRALAIGPASASLCRVTAVPCSWPTGWRCLSILPSGVTRVPGPSIELGVTYSYSGMGFYPRSLMYLRFLVYSRVQLVRECEKLLEQTGIAYYQRYEATSNSKGLYQSWRSLAASLRPPIALLRGSHLDMPSTAL